MSSIDRSTLIVNCADRRFPEIVRIYHRARQEGACRVQIGSYTCGNYFRGLLGWLAENPLPAEMDGYDVVLPVFSESQLPVLQDADAVLRSARHLVVNDFGMLRRFSGDSRVRLGRLLFRDFRDHRYPQYETNSAYQPKAAALLQVLREMGYAVSAMETDLITPDYVVDTDGIDVYYHFPYRQVSSGHICEFAAIGRPVDEKFVPDDGCCFQCFDVKLRCGADYVKAGRSVFDLLPESWLQAMPRARLIYTPGW